MKKLNSLIFLFYYLICWVIIPSSGISEGMISHELAAKSFYSNTKTDPGITYFLHSNNADWNRGNRQVSRQDWPEGNGHWQLIFSAVTHAELGLVFSGLSRLSFSSEPIFGSLTSGEIIFPFHYFW
nr:hypothetical protein [Algoriphagus locisalis]